MPGGLLLQGWAADLPLLTGGTIAVRGITPRGENSDVPLPSPARSMVHRPLEPICECTLVQESVQQQAGSIYRIVHQGHRCLFRALRRY